MDWGVVPINAFAARYRVCNPLRLDTTSRGGKGPTSRVTQGLKLKKGQGSKFSVMWKGGGSEITLVLVSEQKQPPPDRT